MMRFIVVTHTLVARDYRVEAATKEEAEELVMSGACAAASEWDDGDEEVIDTIEDKTQK